jgi:hypothetical protein
MLLGKFQKILFVDSMMPSTSAAAGFEQLPGHPIMHSIPIAPEDFGKAGAVPSAMLGHAAESKALDFGQDGPRLSRGPAFFGCQAAKNPDHFSRFIGADQF